MKTYSEATTAILLRFNRNRIETWMLTDAEREYVENSPEWYVTLGTFCFVAILR